MPAPSGAGILLGYVSKDVFDSRVYPEQAVFAIGAGKEFYTPKSIVNDHF
jgi:hypothetical protein